MTTIATFARHTWCVAWLVSLAGGTSHLAAQGATRTTAITDPVVDARTMFAERKDARTVAGAMRQTHRQSLVQSAVILRTIGFQVRDAVAALRTEYTPTASALYAAVEQAGFPKSTLAGAFQSAQVNLDCIDPQGFAIPCGNFGGTSDTPVMGQLSWTPQSEGKTGALLTISGTNMPLMDVRHGFSLLTQVSASSSSIVVRLPSTANVGDLKVVRKSDNATGVLETGYRVIKPPVAWSAFALVAIDAAAAEATRWLTGARIDKFHCVVNGPIAVGVPGVFGSANTFRGDIKLNLVQAGAAADVAQAWDAAFSTAWRMWADQVTIPALPLYPMFLAFPGAQAPPVASVPVPLGTLVSTGLLHMQPVALRARLISALAPVSADESARNAAIDQFANIISARFDAVLLRAMVMKVMGSGPVPKYAPPNVAVAPVESGTCSGTNVIPAQLAVF